MSSTPESLVAKGVWRTDEDECLKRVVNRLGPDAAWATIALSFNQETQSGAARTGKQCRERFMHHLHPDVRHEPWTQAEDMLIVQGHKEHGNKWKEIARFLPGRTESAVKNHWNSTFRKKTHPTRSSVLKQYINELKAQAGAGLSQPSGGARSASEVPSEGDAAGLEMQKLGPSSRLRGRKMQREPSPSISARLSPHPTENTPAKAWRGISACQQTPPQRYVQSMQLQTQQQSQQQVMHLLQQLSPQQHLQWLLQQLSQQQLTPQHQQALTCLQVAGGLPATVQALKQASISTQNAPGEGSSDADPSKCSALAAEGGHLPPFFSHSASAAAGIGTNASTAANALAAADADAAAGSAANGNQAAPDAVEGAAGHLPNMKQHRELGVSAAPGQQQQPSMQWHTAHVSFVFSPAADTNQASDVPALSKPCSLGGGRLLLAAPQPSSSSNKCSTEGVQMIGPGGQASLLLDQEQGQPRVKTDAEGAQGGPVLLGSHCGCPFPSQQLHSHVHQASIILPSPTNVANTGTTGSSMGLADHPHQPLQLQHESTINYTSAGQAPYAPLPFAQHGLGTDVQASNIAAAGHQVAPAAVPRGTEAVSPCVTDTFEPTPTVATSVEAVGVSQTTRAPESPPPLADRVFPALGLPAILACALHPKDASKLFQSQLPNVSLPGLLPYAQPPSLQPSMHALLQSLQQGANASASSATHSQHLQANAEWSTPVRNGALAELAMLQQMGLLPQSWHAQPQLLQDLFACSATKDLGAQDSKEKPQSCPKQGRESTYKSSLPQHDMPASKHTSNTQQRHRLASSLGSPLPRWGSKGTRSCLPLSPLSGTPLHPTPWQLDARALHAEPKWDGSPACSSRRATGLPLGLRRGQSVRATGAEHRGIGSGRATPHKRHRQQGLDTQLDVAPTTDVGTSLPLLLQAAAQLGGHKSESGSAFSSDDNGHGSQGEGVLGSLQLEEGRRSARARRRRQTRNKHEGEEGEEGAAGQQGPAVGSAGHRAGKGLGDRKSSWGQTSRGVSVGSDAWSAGGSKGMPQAGGASQAGTRFHEHAGPLEDAGDEARAEASFLTSQSSPWTDEQAEALVRLVAKHGENKWNWVSLELASMFPGYNRTSKQCREKWNYQLCPSARKGHPGMPWTAAEEQILVDAHKEQGNRWSEISRLLPDRTETNVKNHWNTALRRKHPARCAEMQVSILDQYQHNYGFKTFSAEALRGLPSTGPQGISQASSMTSMPLMRVPSKSNLTTPSCAKTYASDLHSCSKPSGTATRLDATPRTASAPAALGAQGHSPLCAEVPPMDIPSVGTPAAGVHFATAMCALDDVAATPEASQVHLGGPDGSDRVNVGQVGGHDQPEEQQGRNAGSGSGSGGLSAFDTPASKPPAAARHSLYTPTHVAAVQSATGAHAVQQSGTMQEGVFVVEGKGAGKAGDFVHMPIKLATGREHEAEDRSAGDSRVEQAVMEGTPVASGLVQGGAGKGAAGSQAGVPKQEEVGAECCLHGQPAPAAGEGMQQREEEDAGILEAAGILQALQSIQEVQPPNQGNMENIKKEEGSGGAKEFDNEAEEDAFVGTGLFVRGEEHSSPDIDGDVSVHGRGKRQRSNKGALELLVPSRSRQTAAGSTGVTLPVRKEGPKRGRGRPPKRGKK